MTGDISIVVKETISIAGNSYITFEYFFLQEFTSSVFHKLSHSLIWDVYQLFTSCHQYTNSPCCSSYLSHSTDKENLLDSHKLLLSVGDDVLSSCDLTVWFRGWYCQEMKSFHSLQWQLRLHCHLHWGSSHV